MVVEKTECFNIQSNTEDKLNDIVSHVTKKSYLGKLWSSIKFLCKYHEILTDNRIQKFIQNNSNLAVLSNIQYIALVQLSQRKDKNANESYSDKSVTYLTSLKNSIDQKITSINTLNDNRIDQESANKKIDLADFALEDSNVDQMSAPKKLDLANLDHESMEFKKLQTLANAESQNDDDVIDLFSGMIENGKIDQARLLLKYFIEEADRRIDDAEDDHEVSQIKDFKHCLITDVAKVLKAEKYLAGRNILTTYSVNLIINRIKAQKPELNNLPCIICDSRDKFQMKLEKLYGKGTGPDKCFFIFRNSSEDEIRSTGGHLTPVYIEKDKTGFRAVIMDATSNPMYYGPAEAILKNVLPTRPTIYTGTFQRQKDATNCPIFCIRDFVQFARHGQSMMQRIIETSKQTNLKQYEFTTLPSQLMKVTQSLRDIIEYEEAHGPIGLKMKHIKKKFRIHFGVEEKILQNAKIEKLATKYQFMILDELMARKA